MGGPYGPPSLRTRKRATMETLAKIEALVVKDAQCMYWVGYVTGILITLSLNALAEYLGNYRRRKGL